MPKLGVSRAKGEVQPAMQRQRISTVAGSAPAIGYEAMGTTPDLLLL